MKFHAAQALALLPVLAAAQRPNGTSICDYYTSALLGSNNATSQYTVLTLLVNTAVIGNWTSNAANVKVNGILNAGTYNGVNVNLLPYFDGSLKSTNRSGVASSVNFLDGGGAAPLKMGMASNNAASNQERLLTHLYEFFGALLGCSAYGQTGFPAYTGKSSMYAVHGFMALGPNANGYFIQEVALAAASFGVATSDITVVGTALNSLFNVRCAAPAAVLPSAAPELQSICIAATCPLAANNTCPAYPAVVRPSFVNGTVFAPGGNATSSSSTASSSSSTASSSSSTAASSSMSTTSTSTATKPAMVTTNAASSNMPAGSGLVSLVLGLFGFLAL